MAEQPKPLSDKKQAQVKRKIGKMFKAAPPNSPELQRILRLPRRVWQTQIVPGIGDIHQLVAELTAFFKTPHGTMTLLPLQAKSLQEMFDTGGGLFGPVEVGEGKTLLSFLAPIILQAERPLLIVPARLIGKTKREFAVLSQHWVAHPNYRIISYEKISREYGTQRLIDLAPDMFVLDECFPAGTQVTTPTGLRKIENLREGDSVISGDGSCQKVEGVFSRNAKQLMTLRLSDRTIVCTHEHPFLTVEGWRHAKDIKKGNTLVCLVQQKSSQRSQEESFLFSQLLSFLAYDSTRNSSQSVRFGSPTEVIQESYSDEQRTTGASGSFIPKDESSQSNEIICCEEEGVSDFENSGAQTSNSRRQRQENVRTSEGSLVGFGGFGVVVRISGEYQRQQAEGSTELLQNRYSQSYNENSSGSGRIESFDFESTSGRQTQNPIFGSVRLVSVESVELRSAEEHTEECRVYNLQVGGTHTYLIDGIIVHNCHRLKNKDAAVTRRIRDWMMYYNGTKVVALSGTTMNRSIFDFQHILGWCMLEENIPLPNSEKELEAWAAAVDVIKPFEKRSQGGVGALKFLCNAEELKLDRDGVRSAVRRRIQETPGIVASLGSEVGASLNITLIMIEGYNQRVLTLAQGLLDGVKPDGDVITDDDLATKWRVTRTLTSGFWNKWDPAPPLEWLVCRSRWKKTVRGILDRHIHGLESEGLVAAAAATGRLQHIIRSVGVEKIYKEWVEVKDTYKVNTVPVWEDDRMVKAVATWCKIHSGIIWVSEIPLGERLETKLGLPYYHEKGLNRRGGFIDDANPKNGSIVASVGSNNEGRNLQAWCDNLIISPPPTGTVMEQLLGRTHRRGQEADEVWCDILIGCSVEFDCWKQACRDAHAQTLMEGKKKLSIATVDQTFQPPYGRNALWAV